MYVNLRAVVEIAHETIAEFNTKPNLEAHVKNMHELRLLLAMGTSSYTEFAEWDAKFPERATSSEDFYEQATVELYERDQQLARESGVLFMQAAC